MTTFEEAGEDFMARFPTAPKSPHTIISVQMNVGAQVEVDGFGLQFSNTAEPVMEGWLNRDESIFPGVTLQTFLNSERFHLLVPDSLPSAQAAYGDKTNPPPRFPIHMGRSTLMTCRGMDRFSKRPKVDTCFWRPSSMYASEYLVL